MKKFNLLILSILLITTIGCSNLTGKFKFMNELKNSVSEKYGTEEVEVQLINKNDLLVVLKDSKFENYSPEEKKDVSLEIGEIVSNLNTNDININNGQVQFLTEKDYGLIKTGDAQSFKMHE